MCGEKHLMNYTIIDHSNLACISYSLNPSDAEEGNL